MKKEDEKIAEIKKASRPTIIKCFFHFQRI
jgi:hypothetical protein